MTDEQFKQIIDSINNLDNTERIFRQNESMIKILVYVQKIAEHLKIKIDE